MKWNVSTKTFRLELSKIATSHRTVIHAAYLIIIERLGQRIERVIATVQTNRD